MFVVTGYLTIDPAKRGDLEAAVQTAIPAFHQEEGCIDYRFSADLTDPARIMIAEQWADEAAMDAHMAGEAFATFMAAIGPCVAGDVSVVRHEVATSTTLF
ncbi:MAG: antibiotic biosynthesis monooxygenase [Acidimicrobiales bacterium]|nr:antibiotic biosynthesis monooxygenase [Acidimicrobiales bacterium]